ncbi:MAG: hypothetical protein Alpg2KO_28150 [Alphaproteobacteria bacterium]
MTPSKRRLFKFFEQQPVQSWSFTPGKPGDGPVPPEGKAPFSLRVLNALARAAGGAGKSGQRLARAHGADPADAAAASVLSRTPSKPWDFSAAWKDRQATEMTTLAETLSKDPHVQQAAIDWGQLPRRVREQVLQRVHNLHARQLGFSPVKVRLKDMESLQLGSMAVPMMHPFSRKIKAMGIVLTGMENARFDSVLELLVHESRHVQQYDLINRLRNGQIKRSDPCYKDMLALSRNMDGYIFPSGIGGASRNEDIQSYRIQPVEDDARAAASTLRRNVTAPPRP